MIAQHARSTPAPMVTATSRNGEYSLMALGVSREGLTNHALVAAHLLLHELSQEVLGNRYRRLVARIGIMGRPRPRYLWAICQLSERLAEEELLRGRRLDA